jgi:alkane 1-monooxygenase
MWGLLSSPARFALALLLPLSVGAGAWHSPWTAWAVMFGWQVGLALLELAPGLQQSAAATPATPWHRWCIRLHLPLQFGLQALGAWLVLSQGLSCPATLALAIAVGGVAGAQGITFAHELGHSQGRVERFGAWLLMGSVSYAHFMVEHYRGHHVRAATPADPATARRGESLWRFLPRVIAGSWCSAWRLEAQQLQRLRRGWAHSPLVWACAGQLALWVGLLAWGGSMVLLFWMLQSAYAVFLLETTNYIEHYGLVRARDARRADGHEAIGAADAWAADHALTNCVIANLQRHADHHMNPGRPYAELRVMPGPTLPTGYAGCLLIATWPRLWFHLTEPRLRALQRTTPSAMPETPVQATPRQSDRSNVR